MIEKRTPVSYRVGLLKTFLDLNVPYDLQDLIFEHLRGIPEDSKEDEAKIITEILESMPAEETYTILRTIVDSANQRNSRNVNGERKMSFGIGAFATLESADDYIAVYSYGGFNLNEEKYDNPKRICDGTITIERDCFKEPEIHMKEKRMPGGKKRLVKKRVPVPVDYSRLHSLGKITIENCSNCWHINPDGIDFTAFNVLHKLFYEYQMEGQLPKQIYIFK